MIENIYINFLPGSAGNFLSRALQLAIPKSCCWVDSNGNVLESESRKLLELSYKKNKVDNWIEFEESIVHFTEVENFQQPKEFVFIDKGHLFKTTDIDLTNSVLIQIDIKNKSMFEWTMLNCFYKQSKPTEQYFKIYQTNKINNKDLIEIDLENFFLWNTFKNEIEKILKIVNIDSAETNWKLVETLYTQWWETTLNYEDFDRYKNDLGWLL